MKHLLYPKTKEEWWSNVNEAWPDLLNIMERYFDLQSRNHDWEDVYDCNGNLFKTLCPTEPPPTLQQHIEELRETKNPKLVRWFNITWLNSPDNSSIWDLPHWETLCDLCSEEYVLYPEEDQYA